MAGTLSTVSIISFVAAGVFFVVAIVFWIVFHIPSVIGDLTGKNAKKNIDAMRRNNERTGNKAYRSSKINLERGKVTSPMTAETPRPEMKINPEVKIQPTDANETDTLEIGTSPMYDTAEAETTMLNYKSGTDSLYAEGDTQLLQDDNQVTERMNKKTITIIDEELMIHSNEDILKDLDF